MYSKDNREEEEENESSTSTNFRRTNNGNSMNVDSVSSFSQRKKDSFIEHQRGQERFQTDNDKFMKL